MNINDFISENCYKAIKNSVDGRQNFEYAKTKKENGGSVTLRISGNSIDDDTATKIWNGHAYLVHFNGWYDGKSFGGLGGFGFAIDDFQLFDSFESFRSWVDKNLSRIESYDAEEKDGRFKVEKCGQMVLF